MNTTAAPRKQPVQRRSRATVDAILEATARVLVREGDAFTTTRVAAVAGVGVGTLYQYFPSKDALVAAILDRHAQAMEAAIARALAEAGPDASLGEHVEALIVGLLRAKSPRVELSQAVRRALPQRESNARMRASIRRIQSTVRALLEQHRGELRGVDLDLCATMLVTAVEGALTSALEYAPGLVRKPEFADALTRLVKGYLRECGWRRAQVRHVAR